MAVEYMVSVESSCRRANFLSPGIASSSFPLHLFRSLKRRRVLQEPCKRAGCIPESTHTYPQPSCLRRNLGASGMSRRILPLSEDHFQHQSAPVVPTRANLRRSASVIQAESRLKQKGWRVTQIRASHDRSCYILLTGNSVLNMLLCCRQHPHS